MNTKPLCSVIVPVYQVRDTLQSCVESIFHQTYPNLEIILVDDGSTDSSQQLCDQLASQNSCIQVIHQANCGLGGARNAGLAKCKGQYIGFVDSDDTIEPTMYETLIQACLQHNVRCSVGNIIRVSKEGQKTYKSSITSPIIMNKKQIINNIACGDNSVEFSACNKVFERSLFETRRFPEGGSCEDLVPVFEAMMEAESIVHIGSNVYNYQYDNSKLSSFSQIDANQFTQRLKLRSLIKKEDSSCLEFFDREYVIGILFWKMESYVIKGMPRLPIREKLKIIIACLPYFQPSILAHCKRKKRYIKVFRDFLLY